MKIKLKERKISDLIGSEYNPRVITQQELTELQYSIKRFGLVEPILVNINNKRKDIIISGHQRIKACLMLDMTVVPCIELNLTLNKEKELNVRMNKNGGRFDVKMLTEHFEKDVLIDIGFQEHEFTNTDVSIDGLFEDVEVFKPTEPTNKIVLEYNDEDYKKVIDKLAELDGTKEEIIYKLLGL
jgi:hypothetical protein